MDSMTILEKIDAGIELTEEEVAECIKNEISGEEVEIDECNKDCILFESGGRNFVIISNDKSKIIEVEKESEYKKHFVWKRKQEQFFDYGGRLIEPYAKIIVKYDGDEWSSEWTGVVLYHTEEREWFVVRTSPIITKGAHSGVNTEIGGCFAEWKYLLKSLCSDDNDEYTVMVVE